jgi:hypothetical protein
MVQTGFMDDAHLIHILKELLSEYPMKQRILLEGVAIVASLAFSLSGYAQTVATGEPCKTGNCNTTTGHHHVVGGAVHGVGSHIHGVAAGLQAHAIAGAANPYGHNSMPTAWVWHSTWGDYWARNQAMQRPWHGNYYWWRTGQPTALVVPPTVTMQSNYSWGVSQNTMTPVYHQFSGNPPNGAGGGSFRATPVWPTHTDQIGVYPVRGPW